jgi:hypothetical protein
MSYPSEPFEKIAQFATSEYNMIETKIHDWAALRKWHDEVLLKDHVLMSCPHWCPGLSIPGFIALDSIRPKLRTIVLCPDCFTVVVEEMRAVGLKNDHVCNLCGQAPPDNKFADIIVALRLSITLVGQACHACVDSQITEEEQ